ncbi:MAG TPA: hypothetical protein VM925_28850, partial [Labilithrix sp.]|nr:hypothetical protein [Labilithrix sp.]
GKQRAQKRASTLDGDSVEALLALADASGPVAPASGKSSAAHILPPVAATPPANLPPSPVFGPTAASPSEAASAPRAPAARRQALEAPVPEPAPVEEPYERVPVSFEEPSARREPPKPVLRPVAPIIGPASAEVRRAKLEGASAKVTTSRSARKPSGGQPPRAPKTGMALLVFALLVLAGGTVAIWFFAPQLFTGRKKAASSATAPPSALLPPAPKCKVALVLTDVPPNAEILLRMGQAPLDVERMPVGTRLEFVATAEGYAPRRAVIKGESTWDKGPDGKPRIEVPIQLDPSKAKPGTVDPWPLAEPGSQVGGSGAPGTVHVVSNVRGAEVWLLAGLGPEARIDQLRCDADIDVLFAGPPALRRRLHVGEKEVEATPVDPAGNKVVTVSAK